MDTYILEFIDFFLDKNVFIVYMLFFLSNLMQMLFPPHPGDVILIFQGYTTTVHGSYNLFLLYLNAMAASFLGSYILFKLGYHKGKDALDYKIVKRFIKEKHIKRAEKLFDRFGIYAIALSKFVPGVNALIIILAGTFKMNKRLAYISFLASSSVHHIILLLLGRFLGHNMDYIKDILKTYNSIVVVIILLAVSSILLYKYVLRPASKRGC